MESPKYRYQLDLLESPHKKEMDVVPFIKILKSFHAHFLETNLNLRRRDHRILEILESLQTSWLLRESWTEDRDSLLSNETHRKKNISLG